MIYQRGRPFGISLRSLFSRRSLLSLFIFEEFLKALFPNVAQTFNADAYYFKLLANWRGHLEKSFSINASRLIEK